MNFILNLYFQIFNGFLWISGFMQLHKRRLSYCVHRNNMNSKRLFLHDLDTVLDVVNNMEILLSRIHPHPPVHVALQFEFSFAHSIQWPKFICPHIQVWGFIAPTHNFFHSSTHFTAELQDIPVSWVPFGTITKSITVFLKVFKNLLKKRVAVAWESASVRRGSCTRIALAF